MDRSVGPYRIESELGRGGMGVVYRAHDPRLDRTVAIKALPEELAGDPGRLERFEREARTLAQLNHPNLAGIHGLEEHEGNKYLVLEFVEGETLADRLSRGVLETDEAVELATQIAAGVEAAHEAGVVHRDLKPGNIMLTPEGRAKVLDFGLARTDSGTSSTGSGLSQSPTMTTPMGGRQPQHSPTIPGAILGTAAYMSPEQARGRRVDKRTDVWSFGVVLYEMLMGASPFVGETASDSIGAVLHKDFKLDALPAGVPANVRRVLKRCLQRDKALRYRDIGDARLELISGSVDEGTGRQSVRGAGSGSGVGLLGIIGLVVGLVGLVAAGVMVVQRGETGVEGGGVVEAGEVLRYELWQPDTRGESPPQRIAISPTDDRIVAWVGDLSDDNDSDAAAVCVLNLETGEARRLAGTEYADSLAFSPDGQTILFHVDEPEAEEEFRRVSVDGGPVLKVVTNDRDRSFVGYFAYWNEPESVYLMLESPHRLCRVSIATGEVTELGELVGGEDLFTMGGPTTAGDGVVFVAAFDQMGLSSYTIDLETREVQLLTRASGLVYLLPGDRVAVTQDKTLCVAAYDPETRSIAGELRPVLPDLQNEVSFAVSGSGDLLAIRNLGDSLARTIHAIDRAGNHEALVDSKRGYYGGISVLPGGDRVYVGAANMSRSPPVIGYLIDLETGGFRRVDLPSEFGFMTIPEYALPDGRLGALAYKGLQSYEMVLFDPDRPGEVEAVLPEPDGIGRQTGMAFAGDGRYLLFEYLPSDDREDGIYWIDLEEAIEDRVAKPLVVTPSREVGIEVSPDGKWVLYYSNSSGGGQVMARRFEVGAEGPRLTGRPVRVSIEGGRSGKWSPDGDEVFLLDNDDNMLLSRVERDEAGELTGFSSPEMLIDAETLNIYGQDLEDAFSVLPDGRFIYVREPSEEQSDIRFDYTRNWVQSLTKE